MEEGKMRNNLSVAGNGVDAIALLCREGDLVDVMRPEVILLDLILPKGKSARCWQRS
jgi:hypothetical protein